MNGTAEITPEKERIDAALTYIGHGFSLVPLKGKKPIEKGWTSLPKTIEAQALQYARSGNFGIRTGKISGVIVIDVDVKNGGMDNLEKLHLPKTPTVRTGSGGLHFYFKYPEGGLRNSQSKLAPGIDIRADGGQVVASPSTHPDTGKPYTWEISLDDCPLAELPLDILKKLKKEKHRQQNKASHNGNMPPLANRIERASKYLTKIPGAVSGEGGHDTMWKAALAIVRGFSLQGDVAYDLLWREYNPRCDPPWTEKEIQHKITEAKNSSLKDGYLLGDAAYSQTTNRKSQPEFETPPGAKSQAEPKISKEAFHGLAGDIVHMIEPHTEADPVGLLVSILAEFGAIVTRKPHLILDASYHPLLFYPVLVGNSSKSRKGSSGKRIKTLFEKVDPDWTRGRYKGTLSTGEGLCFAVRDEAWEKNKKGKDILNDEGVQDKRLFLVQSEFGAVLKTMSREGNSLSGALRDAWDGEDLAPMTKGSRTRSTSPHIVIVGHVTRGELLRNLNATEASNGFGNRFAWFHVKRSKELPFPGLPEASEENRMITSLREALRYSENVDEITLSEAAKNMWEAVYSDLSKDRPGLSGSLLNRSEAYVMRLSAIYALLECKSVIDTPHMLAALALWQYAIESVFFIFGDKTGDSVADAILEALQQRGEMTNTEITAMFNRNKSAERLSQAKDTLKKTGLIVNESRKIEGGIKGQTITVWRLT